MMSARPNRAAPAVDTSGTSGETRPTTDHSSSATPAATPGSPAEKATSTKDVKQVLSALWDAALRPTAGKAKKPATTKARKRGVTDPSLSRGRRKRGGEGVRYIPGVHEQVEEALRKKVL